MQLFRINVGDPHVMHDKYDGFMHKLFTGTLGVALVCTCVVYTCDCLTPPSESFYFPRVGAFVAVYLVSLVFVRVLDHGSYVFWELLWCCNSGQLLVIFGVLTGRPLLVGAAVTGVIIDQLSWYIDILSFLITGRFIVGVAKYLIWPTTTNVKRITSSHHLWFIPLCLCTLRWQFPRQSWLLSCMFTSTSSLFARILTPRSIKFTFLTAPKDKSLSVSSSSPCQGDKEATVRRRQTKANANDMRKSGSNQTETRQVEETTDFTLYEMNINAGYGFWVDIKVGFLHWFDDASPFVYLPYLIFVGNTILNLPPYLLLNSLLEFTHKFVYSKTHN